jgi:hypothetical protein
MYQSSTAILIAAYAMEVDLHKPLPGDSTHVLACLFTPVSCL